MLSRIFFLLSTSLFLSGGGATLNNTSTNKTVFQPKITEKKELTTNTSTTENTQKVNSNISTLSITEKISLYKKLFRGRDDVYAIRWENKNGRAGYSPVCANEWDIRCI